MGIVLLTLILLAVLAVAIGRWMPYLRLRALMSRLARYIGWGGLLLPVALMCAELWGMNSWAIAATLTAAGIVVLLPAVAADLAAAALMLFGLYGVVIGVFGPSVAAPVRQWSGPLYGTFNVDSRWAAVLTGLEGLALAGFGLWLVPRTLSRYRQVAVLLGLGQEWLERRGFRPAAGPDRGGPDRSGPDRSGRDGAERNWAAAGGGPLARWAGPVRRQLDRLGWGAALLPTTLIFLPMHSFTAFAVVATLAVVITVLLPGLAARIVPVALVIFGLLGMVVGLNWFSAFPQGHLVDMMYGIAYLDSPRQAVLAGAEGVLFLSCGLWLAPLTLGGGQMAALAGRVQRLAQTRTDAVDVAAAELRRVERDLHDGAQARLVALGMSLRAAERLIHSNPAAAGALVAEARDASSRALTDLRDLVRGIHPPVLADRGLRDAVRAIALDTPVRTELDIDLPGRLAAPVESAVYFAIAEALANVVKHASARSVHIRMAHSDGMLRAEVTDDGTGGANPARGSGLRGIERRLGTFDGVLAVSSPPGGPTIVVIEVPCELSSPRTYSS